MEHKRPVIAVTPWYDYEKEITYIKKGYMEAILKAGGLPLLLPISPIGDVSTNFILSQDNECTPDLNIFDGLLISGGPDVDARLFGEENMHFTGNISPKRDRMEIKLVKECIAHYKPILGICRGIQVINVALGGTLYQDIQSQHKNNKLLMHEQKAPKWYPIHSVSIEKESLLFNIFKVDNIGVNSFHHQAINDTSPDLEVTAYSSDGIIEAVEYSKRPFVLGVQWHPELMYDKEPLQMKLFTSFINACR